MKSSTKFQLRDDLLKDALYQAKIEIKSFSKRLLPQRTAFNTPRFKQCRSFAHLRLSQCVYVAFWHVLNGTITTNDQWDEIYSHRNQRANGSMQTTFHSKIQTIAMMMWWWWCCCCFLHISISVLADRIGPSADHLCMQKLRW